MDMLQVTAEALEFIRQRGGVAMLVPTKTIGGCCGGLNMGPEVQLGIPSPDELVRHNRYEFGPVTVFVPKELFIAHPVRIEVSNFLWRKYLVLEGWKII